MHRRPIVIANWKMYTSAAEAMTLASRVRTLATGVDDVEIVLLPPVVWLPLLVEHLHHRPRSLNFGVQNFYPVDEGAFTGEVSGPMVKPMARYALVGHSERRTLFNEDDELIHKKLVASFELGLSPILCVGELTKVALTKRGRGRPTVLQRESDIYRQLDSALAGMSTRHIENLVVAYEPLWAVGTGNNVPAAHVEEVLVSLRKLLIDRFGELPASRIRMVYGGSVTAETAQEYLAQPHIDGFLVGGASRDLGQFSRIVSLLAERAHHRIQHPEHESQGGI